MLTLKNQNYKVVTDDIIKTYMRPMLVKVVNKIDKKNGKIIFNYGGYPIDVFNNYIASIIRKDNIDANYTAALINDFDCAGLHQLMKLGVKKFILVATDESMYKTLTHTCGRIYAYDAEEYSIKVLYLKDIYNMHIDLIISNPPYGKIGADITKSVIDNVDFEQFINIFPVDDYNKFTMNNVKTCNFLGNNMFPDAAVECWISEITKTKCNNFATLDDFKSEFQREETLQKFYKKNDSLNTSIKYDYWAAGKDEEEYLKNLNNINSNRSFILVVHASHNGVSRTENAVDRQFNLMESISKEELHYYYDTTLKLVHTNYARLIFPSHKEKLNFAKWYYNNNGHNLMTLLLRGLRKGAGKRLLSAVPKVDWAREWTDEEILIEFGYIKEERDYILSDAFYNYLVKEDKNAASE